MAMQIKTISRSYLFPIRVSRSPTPTPHIAMGVWTGLSLQGDWQHPSELKTQKPIGSATPLPRVYGKDI